MNSPMIEPGLLPHLLAYQLDEHFLALRLWYLLHCSDCRFRNQSLKIVEPITFRIRCYAAEYVRD
ncbi:hypothetical protein [Albidovulum aquaemixtae]|uniref:hypothetical protein n=1 Tax=Albidovulum aquaemixtae TaxID=1542388 RepID=UPI0011B2829F|nr:hypothetical protein [Defluviimonas aquaemixtae]